MQERILKAIGGPFTASRQAYEYHESEADNIKKLTRVYFKAKYLRDTSIPSKE